MLAQRDVAQRRRAEQAAERRIGCLVLAQRSAGAEVEEIRIVVVGDVRIARHAERDQAVVGKCRRTAVERAFADMALRAIAFVLVVEKIEAALFLCGQRRAAGEICIVFARVRIEFGVVLFERAERAHRCARTRRRRCRAHRAPSASRSCLHTRACARPRRCSPSCSPSRCRRSSGSAAWLAPPSTRPSQVKSAGRAVVDGFVAFFVGLMVMIVVGRYAVEIRQRRRRAERKCVHAFAAGFDVARVRRVVAAIRRMTARARLFSRW